MTHLKSNQRLYISKDLRGYGDKLIDDGTIPYAVDFLQLGFAYAVREELEPAGEYDRHTITTNTDILGDGKHVVEAVAQWYARKSGTGKLNSSDELLEFVCAIAITGGRRLQKDWKGRSKSQVQSQIASDI